MYVNVCVEMGRGKAKGKRREGVGFLRGKLGLKFFLKKGRGKGGEGGVIKGNASLASIIYSNVGVRKLIG